LKLFNMIAREIGPGVMQKGVRLSAARLAAVFGDTAGDLSAAVTDLTLDDRPLSVAELLTECSRLGETPVRLTVNWYRS
jgi:hypothetical protein